MNRTITLSPTDLSRLADIRKMREAEGKAWPGDEAMLSSIVSRGIFDELRDEQAYAEARENPMRINERGSIDLIMRQAM